MGPPLKNRPLILSTWTATQIDRAPGAAGKTVRPEALNHDAPSGRRRVVPVVDLEADRRKVRSVELRSRCRAEQHGSVGHAIVDREDLWQTVDHDRDPAQVP
jgi:hypothetical protein